MRFLECKAEKFGKLNDQNFTFSEGINVVTGPNEAGKSTMYRFLQGMLFGIVHGRGRAVKDSLYVRYKPWDTPGAYQGTLDVEVGGKKYHLERDFLQTEGGLTVINAENGRNVALKGDFFETVAPKITESGFMNTVMQPQGGAATDKELASLLQNTITNMSMAKNRFVDVGGAIENLNGRIKAIEKKHIEEQIEQVERSIEDDEITRTNLDNLNAVWSEQSAKLSLAEARISELEGMDSSDEEQACQKYVGDYEHYRDNLLKEEERTNELAVKKQKLDETEASIRPAEEIKKEIEEWEAAEDRLDKAEAEWDAEKRLATKNRDEQKATKQKLPLYVLILSVMLLAGALLIWKKSLWCIAPFVVAVGVAVWFWLERRTLRKKTEEAEQALQKVCSEVPEELTLAKEAMAALPSEEETRGKERRNIEAITRAEQLREVISESEDKLERFRAELISEKNRLLAFFRGYEPEMETLSDGEVSRIQGSILARSVEQRENLKQARADRDELTKQVAKLEQSLETADSVEERLSENRRILKKLKQEQAEGEQEQKAVSLAMATIHSIAQDIHDSYGKKMNARMSELIERITAQRYGHITMDENLKVKAGHKNHMVELEKLSSGTMEQIYLAERISIGETMYEEKMPLVFDDSFVYYDNERLKETLKLLSELNRQVIICTCSDREVKLLKELKIPHNLIEM